MATLEDHEGWVTGLVRKWFASGQVQRLVVDAKVKRVVEENRDARAAGGTANPLPGEPEWPLDEDVEWLADELASFATQALVPQVTGIREKLVADCLSETDWATIAEEYLKSVPNDGREEK